MSGDPHSLVSSHREWSDMKRDLLNCKQILVPVIVQYDKTGTNTIQDVFVLQITTSNKTHFGHMKAGKFLFAIFDNQNRVTAAKNVGNNLSVCFLTIVKILARRLQEKDLSLISIRITTQETQRRQPYA